MNNKLFSSLKSICKTKGQRKAFNELIKCFATDFDNILSLIRRDIKNFQFKLKEDTPDYYIMEVISPSSNKPFNIKVIKTGQPIRDFNDAVSKMKLHIGNFDDELRERSRKKLASLRELKAREGKGYIYMVTDINWNDREYIKDAFETVYVQITDGKWENNIKMQSYCLFFSLVNYNGKVAFEVNPYAYGDKPYWSGRPGPATNPYQGRSPFAILKWWLDQYKNFVNMAVKDGSLPPIKKLNPENKEKVKYGYPYIHGSSEYSVWRSLKECQEILNKFKTDPELNKPFEVKYPY